MIYLVDKSALARIAHPLVAAKLSPIIEAGLVATCSIIDLEVLYSTRNGEDHAETARRRTHAYARLEIDQAIFDRAVELQGQLASRGHHRAVSIADLLIAAVAERHQATVLHYDKDFDLLAAVISLKVEWVVPQGTI